MYKRTSLVTVSRFSTNSLIAVHRFKGTQNPGVPLGKLHDLGVSSCGRVNPWAIERLSPRENMRRNTNITVLFVERLSLLSLMVVMCVKIFLNGQSSGNSGNSQSSRNSSMHNKFYSSQWKSELLFMSHHTVISMREVFQRVDGWMLSVVGSAVTTIHSLVNLRPSVLSVSFSRKSQQPLNTTWLAHHRHSLSRPNTEHKEKEPACI